MTRRRRARSTVPVVGAALAGLLLAAVGGLFWLLVVYAQQAPSIEGAPAEVVLELESGLSPDALASRLAEARLLERPRAFAFYARLRGGVSGGLRTGRVFLEPGLAPSRLLARVARGVGTDVVRVTIPEGLTRLDIAARLDHSGICDRSAFLRVTEDPATWADLGIHARTAEGYLFPDTYELAQFSEARDVARRLLTTWRGRVPPIVAASPGTAHLRTDLHWSIHEIVTLASIVERETSRLRERPKIAGVFLNRLRTPEFRPKRLQADPTVAYGCRLLGAALPACSGFDGRHLTREMQADASNPYNTYRIEGLPPGPIGNPGLESIRAVLDAERHGYFYFVADGRGGHTFSTTLAEHDAAIDALRSTSSR